MKRTLIILAATVSTASAQTWLTGDKTRVQTIRIENGYLIEKTPIKILSPPDINILSVVWEHTVGRWQIILRSEKILPKVYKTCRLSLTDWHSATYQAGDKDGGSFLVLYPRSYEHATVVRDALIKQLSLKPKQVTTETKKE